MPIFEFHCIECGKEFEKLVFSQEEFSSIACKCGSRKIQRIMSRPAPPRIQDFAINPDKGGRFRVDDATFHPSVDESKIYNFEFGRSERDRLDSLARE